MDGSGPRLYREAMKHVSTFSGVGGIDLGFERAGIETEFQCEIDAACRALLEARFPGTRRHDDVKTIDTAGLAGCDVLSGGVPCQDWSVAGKRKGLAGARSGLFFTFAQLADRLATRWVLFENVPGLLSACSCAECNAPAEEQGEGEGSDTGRAVRPDHRGHDFATVLGELTGTYPEVPDGGWRNSGFGVGPKRSVAWRVLDAQYLGVAQRRRRLFIVCDSARGTGPLDVLLEPEGCAGNPPPSRQAGARTAATLTRGTAVRGNDPGRRQEDDVNVVAGFEVGQSGGRVDIETAPTLDARAKDGPRRNQLAAGVITSSDPSRPLHGENDKHDETHATYVAEETSKALLAASDRQDPTQETYAIQDGRAVEKGMHGLGVTKDGPVPTLDSIQRHAVGFQSANSSVDDVEELSPTLKVGTGLDIPSGPAVAYDTYNQAEDGDVTATLRGGAGSEGVPAVGLHLTQDPISQEETALPITNTHGSAGVAYRKAHRAADQDDAENWVEDDMTNTLDAAGHAARTAEAIMEPAPVAMRGRAEGAEAEVGEAGVYNALRAGDGGSSRANHVLLPMVVRRLTPTECERLQAFPDGWTEGQPDSTRYRQMGNAVCTSVAFWLGCRLLAVHEGRDPNAEEIDLTAYVEGLNP